MYYGIMWNRMEEQYGRRGIIHSNRIYNPLCVYVLGVRSEKCINLVRIAYKIRPTSSEQAFSHPRWILTLLPIHQQDG